MPEKQAEMSRQPQEPSTSDEAGVSDRSFAAYRFVVAGLVVLLSLSFGLSFFAVSPITPLIIDEYGINRSTASLLTSLVFIAQAGLAIPGSMLVGRLGLKRVIAVGWVLASAPLLSFMAESFPLLLALRVSYGLGFGVMFPALGPLLMQWFRPRELPLINGVFIAVASLGVAISTFVVVPMSEVIGWREALSVFGGVSLLGAVCWLVLGRERRGVGEGESHISVAGAWRVLRSRNTLLLAAGDAGAYALYTAALAWLPTFYHQVHAMSLEKAGVLMGLLSLSGVFSLVVASLLSLRVRRRRPFLIVPGILAGFAGFGSFLLADSAAVYVAVVALGFTSWFYLPVLLTIPMELPGADRNRVAPTESWSELRLVQAPCVAAYPALTDALVHSIHPVNEDAYEPLVADNQQTPDHQISLPSVSHFHGVFDDDIDTIRRRERKFIIIQLWIQLLVLKQY